MTGIELIAQERSEQINLHGITIQMDVENYTEDELRYAAVFCLTLDSNWWPKTWDYETMFCIEKKTMIERNAIAGALLAANIDRIKAVAALD